MTRRTAVTAVAAALLYVVLWIGSAQDWSWLSAFDWWLLAPLHDFGVAHPAWVALWDAFCTIFGPAVFRLVTLIPIIWLLVRGDRGAALFLFVSVELNGVLIEVAKYIAGRARPDTALVSAWSLSFPSGHALGVLVSVLALLTVLLPMVDPRWRRPLMIAGAVIVVAIGWGRVVLNVHHPSDVLAGWALGYLYYLACLPLLTAWGGRPAALDTSR
ncbi:phosphatase PAP2 family protein [Mycolicibacterium chitae]|nr:phosphatase PAP2 family protein [Mycolicibacterium chitae]